MKRVVGGFHRLGRMVVSNVYLLDGGVGSRWLIDCGHWSERWQLLSDLRASGFRPSDLTGVLLTHRHSDHAGNANYLRRNFGLKIYAHRADAEVLEERKPRVPLGQRGGLIERSFGWIENLVPARVPVDRALEEGETVAGMHVHLLAGHTEGSVFYRHETTGCLLTGDTLLTARPPLTLFKAVLPAHPAFSIDADQAFRALRDFHQQGWPYEHVLAGHGRPIVGDARNRVLEEFGW